MHRLLDRQLKKTFGENVDPETFSIEFISLLEKVSDAYDEFTNERKFLEHVVEINSQELTAANRLISEKNESLNQQFKTVSHSRAFLARLIDSVPMFILTLDTEFKILTANARFLESSSKRYQTFLDLFPDDASMRQFKEQGLALLAHQVDLIHNDFDLNIDVENSLYIFWSHTLVEDETGNKIILSIGSDLTHRKEAENAMHWLAHNDSLTNIGNRRAFQNDLHHVLQAGKEGALFFIDVNHFKQINDLYGHPVGDQVLIKIAETLKASTRSSDFVSRLSGDEFTIIMHRVNESQITPIVEKLAKALNSHVMLETGQNLKYTVSIGVALFPLHASQAEELIAKADLAMYQAKKNGMGRWHLYDPFNDKFSSLHEDSLLIRSIKDALDQNRFRLYYQPIFHFEKDAVSHYEVLIRMLDEQGEIVLPNAFIPAAERMGLIQDIDEWVLTHVLEQLASNLVKHPDLRLTVNISAPSMQSADFPVLVNRLVTQSRVPSQHLIIELTETAYIDNFDQVLINLNKINELGIKIALDDFGMGFSSFSYLKKMPLSYIKLDGSYVRGLLHSEEDRVFVESISRMASVFGMETIAEFVEDQATCLRLLELGVSYGQGYFIGKPKPYLTSLDEIHKNIR